MHYTRGGTKTGKALQLAYRMLRSSKRKLRGKVTAHDQEVVVLTDGLTNHDDVATLNTSSVTLRTTAHVIAVGVAGKGYNSERKQQQRAELGQIATSPQDLFYEASFEQLRDQVDPIARRACPLVYKKS
ncbi:Collagen, type VI, alpha 6 [Desmophyllum pertusum]|uniref:Collagen, type VI, alpha 6 n=1 Tax=Desmophyllum pertusum TaxID=174260 RepID=A0A9X0A2S1_9CNID|nr:Collagen, type VI, alpha 6 [Desmophyllum pertusum]